MRIVFVATVVTYLLNYVTAFAESKCEIWRCDLDLGAEEFGKNRTCAVDGGEVNYANQCYEDDHFCLVDHSVLNNNKKCSNVSVVPWKEDLPAGDDCTGLASCYDGVTCTKVTNTTSLCMGKAIDEDCTNDKQCNPGLFCHEKTGVFQSGKVCQPVKKIDETCNADERCEFRSMCVNSTCVEFGNLTDGSRFELMDKELYPSITRNSEFHLAGRVCQNFFAFNSGYKGETGQYMFECSQGPHANFTDYTREADNLTCSFNHITANGTSVAFDLPAKCGFNMDHFHYCPSRRGTDEYAEHNARARTTWRAAVNQTCHHRTSIQY